MAFFDKLNDFAKGVGEKANEAIEITKLNSKINSEKSAIVNDLKQIGEYYYSRYSAGEETDPAIAEYLASVDGHNAAIADAEAQIQTLKEESAAPAPAPAAAPAGEFRFCPECGAKNAAGTKFCSSCGTKLL